MCIREKVDLQKPIFLTGSQRSGSSWTAKILSSATRVAWLDEPFNHKKQTWDVCSAEFPNYFNYIKLGDDSRYRQPINDTLSFKYDFRAAVRNSRSWWELKRIGRAFHKYSKWRRDRWRPLVKQPTGLFMAEWLANEFKAQIVVLVRHPAGYVNSRKQLSWGHDFNDFLSQPDLMDDYLADFEEDIREFTQIKYDLVDQASLLWCILYGTAVNLLNKYPDWIVVRYEDLAFAPEEEFEQLFGKLGLDFSEQARQAIAYHQLSSGETDNSQEWKSLVRNSRFAATKWQKELTKEEIRRVHERVKDVSAIYYPENWG